MSWPNIKVSGLSNGSTISFTWNPCFINFCGIKHEFLEIKIWSRHWIAMCSHESSLWSDNPTNLIKENMLCNNYTITAKHLQFLFLPMKFGFVRLYEFNSTWHLIFFKTLPMWTSKDFTTKTLTVTLFCYLRKFVVHLF